MSESTGWHIDIRESEEPSNPALASASQDSGSRPWVGIQFECCSAYARVYRNTQGTAYEGRCPHCRTPVTLRVGPGGTTARFFKAQ